MGAVLKETHKIIIIKSNSHISDRWPRDISDDQLGAWVYHTKQAIALIAAVAAVATQE